MKHFVVVRTDRIGDTVLSLPFAGFLKKVLGAKVSMLVSPYTFDVISQSRAFHECVCTDKNNLPPFEKMAEWENAIIFFLYPDRKIMKALSRTGKMRIATSHRWYSWLYATHRVNFSRKNSSLHEAQLNFFLLRALHIEYIPSREELIELADFTPLCPLPSHLQIESPFIVFHPASGGHTSEWGFHNFVELARLAVKELKDIKVVFIGTAEEKEKNPIDSLPGIIDMRGEIPLALLPSLLAKCILFVGNSSGPLHIASLLRKKIVGFFPPVRHLSSSRWGPLSRQSLVFSPSSPCSRCTPATPCVCLQQIPPENVLDKIKSRLFQ